jgi:hypothetical protein
MSKKRDNVQTFFQRFTDIFNLAILARKFIHYKHPLNNILPTKAGKSSSSGFCHLKLIKIEKSFKYFSGNYGRVMFGIYWH